MEGSSLSLSWDWKGNQEFARGTGPVAGSLCRAGRVLLTEGKLQREERRGPGVAGARQRGQGLVFPAKQFGRAWSSGSQEGTFEKDCYGRHQQKVTQEA